MGGASFIPKGGASLAAVFLLALFSGPALAKQGSAKERAKHHKAVKHSMRSVPTVESVVAKKRPRGAVQVTARVRFPHTYVFGRKVRVEHLDETLHVRSSGGHLLHKIHRSERMVHPSRRHTSTFLVRGNAARALRRAGVDSKHPRRGAGRLITVTATHWRDVHSGRGVDHAMAVSAAGGRYDRRDQPSARSSGALAGDATAASQARSSGERQASWIGDDIVGAVNDALDDAADKVKDVVDHVETPGVGGFVTVSNRSSRHLYLSSVPTTCVYSGGWANSDVEVFNRRWLASNDSITHYVQRSNGSGPAVPLLATLPTGSTVRSRYSESVKTFAFATRAFYMGSTVPALPITPDYALVGDLTPVTGPSLIVEGADLDPIPLFCDGNKIGPATTAAATFAVGADDPMSGDTAGMVVRVQDKEGSYFTDFKDPNEPGLDQMGLSMRITDDTQGTKNPAIEVRDAPTWTPELTTTPSCDARAWMGCLIPKGGPSSKERPLVDTAIPGTHDTTTVNLGMAFNEDQRGGCAGYTPIFNFDPAVVYNWAVAQNLPVKGQLDRGIRYLDMRASSDRDGNWWPTHTALSQNSLAGELAAISRWALTHPTEAVIVDFNHICPTNGDHLQGFLDLLKATPESVGQPGASDPSEKTASICQLAYRPEATGGKWVGQSTLEEIRDSGNATGQPRNLVVLLDSTAGISADWVGGNCGSLEASKDAPPPATGPNMSTNPNAFAWVDSLWPQLEAPCGDGGAGTNDQLRSYLSYHMGQKRGATPVEDWQFQVSQILYTPETITIATALAKASCPQNLFGQRRSTLFEKLPTRRAIIGELADLHLNIVITDDAFGDDYVSQVAGLNES